MLFIEMTARCNERCLHCYAESGPNRTEALSLQEIHGVLAQARAFGNPTVQFTGGDPMIHPDLAAAVKLASELSYPDIEIYTNGLLLNPRLLSQLAPFSPRFAFSLYSHNASVHDRITRVSGSFERTIAAIRRTKEAGLGVRIGATLMPENQGQEQEISRFIETEIGLPPSHIHFAKIKSVGRGSDRHEAAPADGGSKRHRGRLSETKNQHRQASVRKRYGKLCVAADGNVYPCIFSRHTLLGNIHRQGLTEILHALDQRTLPEPSAVRWESCRQSLSCRDCQIISYALGMENEHAAA
ncbi:MAG: radical SAM protein [Flavobacteriales bacterium]